MPRKSPFKHHRFPRDTILIATRDRLIGDIQSRLNDNARRFLRTLHEGDPAGLPAVRWKLINVNKLKAENPKKHAAQGDDLEKLLG